MAFTSDEKRRDVAARLRKTRGIMAFVEELGIDFDSDWCWNDVSRRVADLIDQTCHLLPSPDGGFGCDRCYTWFPSMNEKTRCCPECGARVVEEGGCDVREL